ncbi:hypothetical protein SAY87_004615 [Trapa incisa]|uniref:FACT complex subunit n=1 Tax=Trapa incisa TaxID=236973 RepID=A0AAN7JU15_9MYRT|nr:hypothetical protein SAY87_004615 [Trapa incisa]
MASDQKGGDCSVQRPFLHTNRKKYAGGRRGRRGSKDPSVSIDLDRFKKRLKILYTHWNERKSDLWQSSHLIFMVYTPEVAERPKSAALNLWLLGYELEDTIMVFMEKEMHILCSTEDSSFLEALQGPARAAIGIDCLLHVKGNRADKEVVLRMMDGLMEDISKGTAFSIPTVGHIAQEASRGWLAKAWTDKFRSLNFPLLDVASGFSDLFSVKDSGEIMNVWKAAYLTDDVMRNCMIPAIKDAVVERVSHSRLTEKARRAVSRAAFLVDARLMMDPGSVGICFGPIIQSGSGFDIRPGHAASSAGLLQYGSAHAVMIALGCSYKGYCSAMVRMILFQKSPQQAKAYKALLTGEEAVIGSLRPGVRLSTVYHAAVSAVEREAPELVPHLTETFGSSMGLEFHESGWAIEARNERTVRQNMVFNVYLGLQDLQKDPKDGPTFSMVLADTVVVGGEDTTVLTPSSKLPRDVSYSLSIEVKDEEEAEAERCVALDRKEAERIPVIGEDIHKMISGELTLDGWLDKESLKVPKVPGSSRRRQPQNVPKGGRSSRGISKLG